MPLPNPPQLYVPGPSKWFVRFNAPVSWTYGTLSAGWYLLGWAQMDTTISLLGSYEDVISEPSGPGMPNDVQRFGENAFFSGTFVRYQEEVLQAIVSSRSSTDSAQGFSSPGALGGLMLQDGLSFQVCIASVYAIPGAGTEHLSNNQRLSPGYTFFNCWLHDNFDFGLSMRVKTPRCIFRAASVMDDCTGRYRLYMPLIPTDLQVGVCS